MRNPKKTEMVLVSHMQNGESKCSFLNSKNSVCIKNRPIFAPHI